MYPRTIREILEAEGIDVIVTPAMFDSLSITTVFK